MKKVGISACFLYPDPSRIVFGPKTLSYVEQDMMDYIAQPGIFPIMIPDLPQDQLEPMLEELDALVLQGGMDLAPETYGEEPIENDRWKGDPYRDEYELRVLDHFMKAGKPVLGICRGLQLMNVYFGGTLYQDTKTQKPDAMVHRDAKAYDHLFHEIDITPASWLSHVYGGATAGIVNTVHHQAIKDLGNDLEVMAISPNDGIVEAIQYTKAPEGRVVGVQWHPEFSATLAETALDADMLIQAFYKQILSSEF